MAVCGFSQDFNILAFAYADWWVQLNDLDQWVSLTFYLRYEIVILTHSNVRNTFHQECVKLLAPTLSRLCSSKILQQTFRFYPTSLAQISSEKNCRTYSVCGRTKSRIWATASRYWLFNLSQIFLLASPKINDDFNLMSILLKFIS